MYERRTSSADGDVNLSLLQSIEEVVSELFEGHFIRGPFAVGLLVVRELGLMVGVMKFGLRKRRKR
jgi:hypothetical protein